MAWGRTAIVDGGSDLWIGPVAGSEFGRVARLTDVVDVAIRLSDVCPLRADGRVLCGTGASGWTDVEGASSIQIPE